MRLHKFLKVVFLTGLLCLCLVSSRAQQTNPVERQVSNPITDTPNVNPVAPEQDIKAPVRKNQPANPQVGVDGFPEVESDTTNYTGEAGSRIGVHEGAVDARFGIYRLQADKMTVYEARNLIIAEGNVVFDQGNDQRITGTKAEFNYKTKLGYFENSTGFSNQTTDGTVVYFTADKVTRTALDEVEIINGKFTACEDTVPKWSFTTKKAKIKTNDRVKLFTPIFKVKDIPIIPLPYASISIKKEDRKSGFLTPSFSYSQLKGYRLSNAYFQTLGRSADVTARLDLFSARGIGYGFDVRTRANSRSYLNFGFYAVKDRLFGEKESPQFPNQGGTSFVAQGVHYFSNGFTAAADVRITSSNAFRQIFFDGIQQIISPIEVSQVSVSKNWNSYSLNVLARSQNIFVPNVNIKTKNLPSISFEKRPSQLSFFKAAYFSFKTSLEGVSRRETVGDINAYRAATGGDPINTPSLVQRFDVNPQVTVPLSTKYFNFTATGGMRVTYYSNSFDDMRRVIGKDVIRRYGEFEFDARPVALARNFYGKNDVFKFRHTVEPYVTYRLVQGVNNFNKIIRFDYADTAVDTNEIEFGLTNRFFTRRYTEAVTAEAREKLKEAPDPNINPLSIQPYELFTLTVRGKYFFDPSFGGALTPGRRNQIMPITQLTAFTFGGVPRNFSPLNVDATYRPRKTVFVNSRLDVGPRNGGLRAISATVGYDTKLLKVFQTFYYTRAVTLIPSLQAFNLNSDKEPGTLRGSQWSPSILLGNRDKGVYGGTSLFLDFQNRREANLSPFVSSTTTLGYAFDCCSVAAQVFTFDLGVRKENRFVFSFRLNGIGSFGTDQFGQGIR